MAAPGAADTAGWAAGAVGSGIAGLLLGAILIPVVQFAVAPAWRWAAALRG